MGNELDPVEEYLIDQANLRGFFGAFSDRDDLGVLDVDLRLEEIIVGLLQPHAPADPRVVKLVVRILQRGSIDPERLLLLAKRERALPVLAWIVDLIPPEERVGSVVPIGERIARTPPRETRRPRMRYDPDRLMRPKR